MITPFKLPPVSLFQDITSVYEDNITYVEFLLGVLKKVNEMISDVNLNTEFREQSGDLFKTLQEQIIKLEADIEAFKTEVDEDIETRFIALEAQLKTLINNETIYLKSYVDSTKAVLEAEIEAIKVGDIKVYDPTTGLESPIQSVINNIYDSTRTDAIMATEFDGLELTASAYDAMDITAFNFDQFGRTILIG